MVDSSDLAVGSKVPPRTLKDISRRSRRVPVSTTSPRLVQSSPSREDPIFDALVLPGEDGVRIQEILRVLRENGLQGDDPRLRHLFEGLCSIEPQSILDRRSFRDVTRSGLLVLESAVARTMVIPEFDRFGCGVRDIFAETSTDRTGRVADHTPRLSRIEPEQFAASICTIDGQRLSAGDSRTSFCVQSVSSPLNYCFALEESGEDEVHRHMGCEPRGVSVNDLALNRNGVPHNPMINAGGIMSCSLIKRDQPLADRFDHVTDMWTRLSGGVRPGFSHSTYLSERQNADWSFALAYSMREHRAFPKGADLIENLEFYSQCRCLEMNVESLSVVAATLANGGICPLTGERVLSPRTVQSCLSLMLTCGLDDHSGQWALRIGLPAKSGISGVILTVIPSVLGIGVWSPRLDAQGHSVRGTGFCRRLVEQFGFHVYEGLGGSATKKEDPRRMSHSQKRELHRDLCWAAREGDRDGVHRLVIRGANVNGADYDGRTPLHLAASEGRLGSVKALLRLGANPSPKDRWGHTPMDDAQREGHGEIAECLTEHLSLA